jgi:uracil-DNA glycosylase
MDLLVLGQNPARASKTGKPFIDTKSGERLLFWLYEAGVERCVLSNLSDMRTDNNKPLRSSEVRSIAMSDDFKRKISVYQRIIAVGRQAEKALEFAKSSHKLHDVKVLYIPHPSGLNRFYNQPGKEQEVIQMIATFVGDGIKV